MSDVYVVTLKWSYPYYEAVGAKQTDVELQAPTTPRLLLDEMIRRYPALGDMLEQNAEGELTALVCTVKHVLAMHHQVNETCTLQVIPPLSGG